ncbi:MAG: WhiB family transcriptional regulator [Microthrixaceae bacterium]
MSANLDSHRSVLILGLAPADSWIADSSCRDLDTGFFFSDDLDDIGSAKRLCLSCPVRARCLDAAVARKEQFGVWGGHLFVFGKIVLSKRRRGRPPLHARPGDTMPEVELPEIHRSLVMA